MTQSTEKTLVQVRQRLAALDKAGHVAGGLPDPAEAPEHDRDARYAIVSLREVL